MYVHRFFSLLALFFFPPHCHFFFFSKFSSKCPRYPSRAACVTYDMRYAHTGYISYELTTLVVRIRSPKLASRLMDSNIWGVLARRIGNGPFLRHAFPLLVAWLERGVVEEEAGEVDADVRLGNNNNDNQNHRSDCAAHAAALLHRAGKGASGGAPHDTQKARSGRGTRSATALSVSSRTGTPGAATPTNGSDRREDIASSSPPPPPPFSSSPETTRGMVRGRGGGGGGGGGGEGVEMTRPGGADSDASRVQVAAAAAVSLLVFECLGKRKNNSNTIVYSTKQGEKKDKRRRTDYCRDTVKPRLHGCAVFSFYFFSIVVRVT